MSNSSKALVIQGIGQSVDVQYAVTIAQSLGIGKHQITVVDLAKKGILRKLSDFFESTDAEVYIHITSRSLVDGNLPTVEGDLALQYLILGVITLFVDDEISCLTIRRPKIQLLVIDCCDATSVVFHSCKFRTTTVIYSSSDGKPSYFIRDEGSLFSRDLARDFPRLTCIDLHVASVPLVIPKDGHSEVLRDLSGQNPWCESDDSEG